jgi:hypothetical protein
MVLYKDIIFAKDKMCGFLCIEFCGTSYKPIFRSIFYKLMVQIRGENIRRAQGRD